MICLVQEKITAKINGKAKLHFIIDPCKLYSPYLHHCYWHAQSRSGSERNGH